MNSIRVFDDFTVTLVPDQIIDVIILASIVTTNPAVSSPHNTSTGG